MVERIQLGFSEQWLAKMITQSDDTWAILKSLPDRPENVPRGYEFLPDAIKRDVEPHGVKALELVQQALAEGDIVALLQGHLGHRKPIPQRIWNKHPLIRKVYPRFTDGKIRMGLHDHEGPHLVGWVAENMPAAPVNIMDQYRPENFYDPHGPKYRERYAALSRRPTGAEIRLAYAHARERGVNFEAITYEKTRRGLFA